MKSTAQHGSFAFAQQTVDGRCHLSFNAAEPFNIQIRSDQVPGMIENLVRVLDADRQRLFEETVRLSDRLASWETPEARQQPQQPQAIQFVGDAAGLEPPPNPDRVGSLCWVLTCRRPHGEPAEWQRATLRAWAVQSYSHDNEDLRPAAIVEFTSNMRPGLAWLEDLCFADQPPV